jgi:hypothetical protein
MVERDESCAWTDYIYANGQKIAKQAGRFG